MREVFGEERHRLVPIPKMERNCLIYYSEVRSRLWETAYEKYDLGAFRSNKGDPLMKSILLVTVLLVAVLPSFADSTTFSIVAYQNGGLQSVPLGPGLDPLIGPTFLWVPQDLVFGVDFTGAGTEVLSAVLDLAGLHLTYGPYTFVCVGQCGAFSDFELPPIYDVTDGTSSVTLNGVTAAYDFRYQSPAPEPTTLVLLGSGLMAGLWRKCSAGHLTRGGSGRLS
jgi:hypothetical protein